MRYETVIFLGGPVDGLHVQRHTQPDVIEVPTIGPRGRMTFFRYRRTAPVKRGEAVIYAGAPPCTRSRTVRGKKP